jgi:hypothetical protein
VFFVLLAKGENSFPLGTSSLRKAKRKMKGVKTIFKRKFKGGKNKCKLFLLVTTFQKR